VRSLDRVRRHFERDARRFDAIYDDRKPLLHRLVDSQRKVVVERFNLIQNLAPLNGRWTALDVGCGSGRYAIALAENGAARVLGVDVASAMIDLARRETMTAGKSDVCEFVVSSFADFKVEERFDVVVATGYFDYLESPASDVQKMVQVCRGRIFASFPKRLDWRVPLRKARFALVGGYVRFYGESEVRGLFASASLPPTRLSLIDLGRDWIAVARTA
jgi:2-polyprenyl-3-methyl-5-hydroxy-6-metoxy-1,4-benzoquinol methylase